MTDREIQFLQAAFNAVEVRIQALDHKAEILAAIALGVMATVGLVASFLLDVDREPVVVGVWVGLTGVAGAVAVAFHLRTIRPPSHDLTRPESLPAGSDYVMWFRRDTWPASDWIAYRERVDRVLGSEDSIESNLKLAHFTSLQLVERKMVPYRRGVLALQISVALGLLGGVISGLIPG